MSRRRKRGSRGAPSSTAADSRTAAAHRVSNQRRGLAAVLVGRSFVHPLFDYLFIGGGLSLLFSVVIFRTQSRIDLSSLDALGYIILLSTSAHFAASTVRLYTKPDAYQSLPFLTMGFPLVAAALLTACMFFASTLGTHLNSLYLTWSPYHYAAQAYGLAVMYSYRSGCMLSSANKRILWWVCMLPFLYAFIKGSGTGLQWILPEEFLATPAVQTAIDALAELLKFLTFAMPTVLFIAVWASASGPMPLIGPLLALTNGIWWIMLPTVDAFIWATVFHGVQYLAIVLIFHVRDQLSRPDNRRGLVYHVLFFYGACVLLGYGLFSCLPWAYQFVGFGKVESILLVVAAINLHHFIVDGYIWRLRKGDTNRKIVDSAQPALAASHA